MPGDGVKLLSDLGEALFNGAEKGHGAEHVDGGLQGFGFGHSGSDALVGILRIVAIGEGCAGAGKDYAGILTHLVDALGTSGITIK